MNTSRRQFLKTVGLGSCGVLSSQLFAQAARADGFSFRYMLASSMYGELPLEVIMPEARKQGARDLDIWPKVHGNQREQMDAMGLDAFERLLGEHQLRLSCLTHYDLGPFGLGAEMKVAKRFGCPLMVCGGRGQKGLKGAALKAAVRTFCEQLKPHLEVAGEHGVTVAIENHGNNLIDSPDSLKWLVELRPESNLKVALAPYHLETLGVDETGLAKLILDLGNEIGIFYAWQHGMGCHRKLPKEQELLQLPGRGKFDFRAVVDALRKVKYEGFTEIFMHPVPRGIPILPTADETTREILRSKAYLEAFLESD